VKQYFSVVFFQMFRRNFQDDNLRPIFKPFCLYGKTHMQLQAMKNLKKILVLHIIGCGRIHSRF